MPEHQFRSHGACIWCGATPEKVADRRAPPFCTERPEETQDERRDGRTSPTGY